MSPVLYIEERHEGKPAREEALLASYAPSQGFDVARTTWKPFVRSRIKPEPGDVVAGSIKFVRSALQSLGKQLPQPDPYPDSLHPWYHRRVWKVASLAAALNTTHSVFVKPAKRWKLFTGFVVDSYNPAELHGVSRREPVWCSEVVRFVSEWRCYVVRGEPRYLVQCDHGGDPARIPDLSTCHDAVRAYSDAPSAYAIDFGVLPTGETALIEANDGFSVGAYGNVPANVYWDMIATRWHELAGPSRRTAR